MLQECKSCWFPKPGITKSVSKRPRFQPREGECIYRCIQANDHESSARDVVEFYNLRGGMERAFDDMNNGFGWKHLPKSFMAQNTVFLLMTTLIRNFYKAIMLR